MGYIHPIVHICCVVMAPPELFKSQTLSGPDNGFMALHIFFLYNARPINIRMISIKNLFKYALIVVDSADVLLLLSMLLTVW